ncbi:MAG: hypothetical protein NWS56_09040, partial [Haliea sp.]|nr:hypothetical protein [Haliea sp.]
MKMHFRRMLLLGLLGPFAACGASADQADVIVYGDYVLTMDEAQPELRGGAVVVRDGVIVDVGPRDRIDAEWQAEVAPQLHLLLT